MPDESEHPLASLLPDQLANLAGVPDASRGRFNELLALALEEAHIWDSTKHHKRLTAADVVPFLRKVEQTLESAETALASLQGHNVDPGNLGAAAWAGSLFESALDTVTTVDDNSNPAFLPQVTAARKMVAAWSMAAKTAIAQIVITVPAPGRGHPRGTGGNASFDTFIRRMDEIAAATDGRWTHTRVTYTDAAEWDGTLLPALGVLRPYLPLIGFFPGSDVNLGFAVERARKSKP